MNRLALLICAVVAFSSTANSLTCYSCYGSSCPGKDQWVKERCSPDSTVCYTFFTNLSDRKVWKKGCAFKDCAHVDGYVQGTACQYCDTDLCNSQRGDEPVAGCIGQPNCPSNQGPVKPWNPIPFAPGAGTGEGGGLSWGTAASSHIKVHCVLILFMFLCTYLRFSL